MADPVPDTLEAVERSCLEAFARAAVDARSPLRWPFLATASDGGADGRILVLRAFDRGKRVFSFWSDRRSAKFDDLCDNADAALLFFDKGRMTQMRVRGPVSVLTRGPDWETALARAAAGSLDDYQSAQPPGAPLVTGKTAGKPPDVRDTFTLLQLRAETVDWLKLSRDGHARALLDWREHSGGHSWRVP